MNNFKYFYLSSLFSYDTISQLFNVKHNLLILSAEDYKKFVELEKRIKERVNAQYYFKKY